MKTDISRPDSSVTGGRIFKLNGKFWGISAAAAVALSAVGAMVFNSQAPTAAVAPIIPSVGVANPLQQNIAPRLGFLGQFSAVNKVELRAQVGGTLTEIHFKDGDIVRKGDLLFVIDPIPYEIKLAQATAQLASANARFDLAIRELDRAETLRRNDAGSVQNVDQRAAEKRAAQAAVDEAKALVRDAKFDLDHCRITAPFTGRIGTHQVSVGNLVGGSRAATSPTTLLTTLVSMDPMYLDFDMSESDYMAFMRGRADQKSLVGGNIDISLADEKTYKRRGTLDFVDNALDRSSGTIHARATVANPDMLLTPGGFARVRMDYSTASPALLVPDASVLPDQSSHIVLTVGSDNKVAPKIVEVGDVRGGLRVIRSGLAPTDRVIIDGIPIAAPGSTVDPQNKPLKFVSDQG
ncbi:efflux RND transporter periplasmic adaptor subunit [Pseudomonas fluorescens]|uniref:efflux RND transporter periplasmic adaptor subunit n=1 Tax=Pseudomonas fluorescens TaxID=294 RepID=UPI000CA2BBA0|nr:efflux RND transporter periplasmic adaptor subunit [Pseudomonas fluorescens]AUM70545.1 efflux transporter periplasmic adaptor subunit [Pseudomonas fluorescens]